MNRVCFENEVFHRLVGLKRVDNGFVKNGDKIQLTHRNPSSLRPRNPASMLFFVFFLLFHRFALGKIELFYTFMMNEGGRKP